MRSLGSITYGWRASLLDCGFCSIVLQSQKSRCCLLEKDELSNKKNALARVCGAEGDYIIKLVACGDDCDGTLEETRLKAFC